MNKCKYGQRGSEKVERSTWNDHNRNTYRAHLPQIKRKIRTDQALGK